MKKIGVTGLRWLKGFHLVAVSCWIGGGVSLLLLYFLKIDVPGCSHQRRISVQSENEPYFWGGPGFCAPDYRLRLGF